MLRLCLLAVLVAMLLGPHMVFSVPQVSVYASPTFKLEEIDGVLIPLQNGLPYPSFEPQCCRAIYSLNGEWSIYYDKNSSFNSLSQRTVENIGKLEQQLKRLLHLSGWEKIRVPSSNNVRGSKHEAYQGVAWYRKVFIVPETFRGKFMRLVFQGVNYFADVWLNGHYLGYHEGGFTPFIFNVTGFLNFGGNNTLIVRVDNTPWNTTKATVPYRICDWWNYGGIYRDVYLEALSPIYIARADVVTYKAGKLWNVNLTLVLHNTLLKPIVANISVEIRPALLSNFTTAEQCVEKLMLKEPELASFNLAVLINTQAIRVVKILFRNLEASVWTPEKPQLYVLHVKLASPVGLDESYVQFGFREVKVKEGKLLLNGKPVFLKGLARHEDYPGKGRALELRDILRDLTIIKQMNANWVRTAHYPNHPFTYVLMDRLGLLVWEEIPVYWFDCEAFKVQAIRGIADQMLLEMIFRDYNRPSIIIWGLANECGCYKERIEYLERQANQARIVDSGRLLAEAIAWDPSDDTWLRAGLDLLAVNAYFGVFYGKVEDLGPQLDALYLRYPSTPILITEFGLWSGGGVGEQRQAEYFTKAWDQIKQRDYLSGACWWTAFDYDSMIVFDTFGAVSWDRNHMKIVYYKIREAYSEALPTSKSEENLLIYIVVLVALVFTIIAVAWKVRNSLASRLGDKNTT